MNAGSIIVYVIAAALIVWALSRRLLSELDGLIVECRAATLCDAQGVGIGALGRQAALAFFRVARLAAYRE